MLHTIDICLKILFGFSRENILIFLISLFVIFFGTPGLNKDLLLPVLEYRKIVLVTQDFDTLKFSKVVIEYLQKYKTQLDRTVLRL